MKLTALTAPGAIDGTGEREQKHRRRGGGDEALNEVISHHVLLLRRERNAVNEGFAKRLGQGPRVSRDPERERL